MVCLLKMGYKAIAMVIVQTLFNVLTLLINLLYCRQRLHIKMYFRKFKWDFLKEVVVYSFWIFLNVIMDKFYWSTGQFVLGAISGTVAVAVFSVAIHLASMYMMFSSAISSVFLPKMTGMVVMTNNKEISKLFIKTGRIQYAVMISILSGFVVFGKQFVILWAGVDYIEAYPMTLLFFFALLIPLIQNLGITILQARNEMKFRSLLYIAIALVALILQVLFAKLWGGLGCAIAIAGALLLGQGLIMNIYYQKKQGLDIATFWKEILKMSIIPVTVCVLSVFIVQRVELNSWSTLCVAILLFLLTFIPLFVAFSLNMYERALLFGPIKRLMLRR